ncbi:MAG: hypothetical protein K0R77_2298 [Chryseobacterium sp.]|jgi:hypothetical protein|uniref:hypothetical protein n=1 Tax=Chryseobacterium sp. TaxID=1871047 RepID=UPI00262D59A7|nr:hypothetical protein [Chryseobacterium sp.]MDF2553023.1 hypothetical protein [Chryseobacterium sp.]
MKNLFSLITIFLFTISYSQELKNFVIPKGYKKMLEIKGDLDKDGKDEIVIVSNTDKKIDLNFSKGDQRELFILKKINGKLKIWKKNSTVLFASETGFDPKYNVLTLSVKNNRLVIDQEFMTNSRHTQRYKHTFRFQNNDFHLIGSINRFDDTCKFYILNEINFSTGKTIIDEQYSSCGENETEPNDYHKEFIHKLGSLVKMNNFTPGENKFKIPNSNKYFYY